MSGYGFGKIYLGAVIYLLSVILLEFAVLLAAEIVCTPAEALSFADSGLYPIVVIVSAAALTYIYFDYIDRKQRFMTDEGESSSSAAEPVLSRTPEEPAPRRPLGKRIFVRSGRMTYEAFSGLVSLILAAQFAAMLSGIGIEALLNKVGLTAALSPSVTTDYTATGSMLFYVAFLGPIAEEFVFRGLILRSLLPSGKCFAITVEALLFSLMHGDINQLLFTFLVGLVLGFAATEFSWGWAAILHIFNNLVLGVLLSRFMNVLPPIPAGILYLFILGGGTAAAFILICMDFDSIKGYFALNRAAPGAWRSLTNGWMILYAACGVILTALGIRAIS